MDQRDPAVARFWTMQVLRLTGVAMAMAGALILADKIDLPHVAGFALLVLGAADFFVIPMILSKRWKSDA